MSTERTIKNVLISVYYKDNLELIISELKKLNATIYSTGGTQTFIEQQGMKVIPVEELTGYPSILGGRVKTLHPNVFGGILARRNFTDDVETLNKYKIPFFDLVIVDLYPFEETVKKGGTEEEIIEKIDIGGISLIRATAKNYADVLIISSRNQYKELIDVLQHDKGVTVEATRKTFAREAFKLTSSYDKTIYSFFNGTFDEKENTNQSKENWGAVQPLRYGENPHQKGKFYGNLDELIHKISGKEISYNNLLDIDAAIHLIHEFNEPTIAILKHNNACGIASDLNLLDAWHKALAGDPVSAFGGVIVSNENITLQVATEMHKLFFEVLIAPGFDDDALQVIQQKNTRIILQLKNTPLPKTVFKTLLNGVIEQDKDLNCESENDLTTVTSNAPTASEMKDLVFANKIAKHSKSNTIVIAKNKQLIASGVGMTSRVDALKHAINKAKEFNFSLDGAVMASDAFFPFPDCVEIANKQGIKAVVQPGGSVKDNLSIDYCNQHDVAMVFTGVRHFRH